MKYSEAGLTKELDLKIVKESIKGSCNEIKEMRSGQAPKPSWNDFKEEIATGGYITKDIKETIDLEHRDYFG